MTPTKLLVGQIFVVFAIVILGLWAATHCAASMLGYQAQLGAPWTIAFDTPLYRPWQLFRWCYQYEAYAPEVFDKAGRSDEHPSELPSPMTLSYSVFSLNTKK